MDRIALLFGIMAAVSGCAQNPPLPVSQLDMSSPLYGPNFLLIAGSANLWEIRSSELALQRSSNPAVRDFAQMIIADHILLAGQMAAAGQAAGFLPLPPEALMPADQGKFDQLRGTPAASFDAVYREMQVAAHQQAIGLFQTYATGGDSAVVRATASQALPILQKHLAAAQALPIEPAPPPLLQPAPVGRGERG